MHAQDVVGREVSRGSVGMKGSHNLRPGSSTRVGALLASWHPQSMEREELPTETLAVATNMARSKSRQCTLPSFPQSTQCTA